MDKPDWGGLSEVGIRWSGAEARSLSGQAREDSQWNSVANVDSVCVLKVEELSVKSISVGGLDRVEQDAVNDFWVNSLGWVVV